MFISIYSYAVPLKALSFGPCIHLLLRDRVHPFSQRDSNVETFVCFRHDAVAPFAGPDDGEAVAAARFARDDDRSAVRVQPMYRSCIEAIQPNDGAGNGHVTSVDSLHGIANTGCNECFFVS